MLIYSRPSLPLALLAWSPLFSLTCFTRAATGRPTMMRLSSNVLKHRASRVVRAIRCGIPSMPAIASSAMPPTDALLSQMHTSTFAEHWTSTQHGGRDVSIKYGTQHTNHTHCCHWCCDLPIAPCSILVWWICRFKGIVNFRWREQDPSSCTRGHGT